MLYVALRANGAAISHSKRLASLVSRCSREFVHGLLATLVLASLTAGKARAQDPVQWTAAVGKGDPAPGGKVAVVVRAAIEPGWYIYSITQGEGGPVPSRISLDADQPFTFAGDIEGPEPKARFDRNFSMQVEVHEGSVAYRVPVLVAPEAAPGEREMLIRARYQACTNRICLPAQTEKISVPVRIAPGWAPAHD